MVKHALAFAAAFLGAVYVSGYHSASGKQPQAGTTFPVASAPTASPKTPTGAIGDEVSGAHQTEQAHKAEMSGKRVSISTDQRGRFVNGLPSKRWPWEDMPYRVSQPKEPC